LKKKKKISPGHKQTEELKCRLRKGGESSPAAGPPSLAEWENSDPRDGISLLTTARRLGPEARDNAPEKREGEWELRGGGEKEEKNP